MLNSGRGMGSPLDNGVGPLRPIGNRPRHTIMPRSLTLKGPGLIVCSFPASDKLRGMAPNPPGQEVWYSLRVSSSRPGVHPGFFYALT